MIDALTKLQDVGLRVSNLVMDGNIQRCQVHGKRGKPGWYVIRELNGKVFGKYGDWTTGETYSLSDINGDGGLTAEERSVIAMMAKQEAKERKAQQKKAAAASLKVWESAIPCPADHPYLVKKQITPHAARFEESTGALLVNLINKNGTHSTLQRIWDREEKGKLLFPGGAKKDCCHVIEGRTDRVFICEGFATGATINEATGCKVLVAIDSGNLLSVAKTAKGTFDTRIIIAADNDYAKKDNVGLRKATEAAQVVEIECVKPTGITGTDFNDMATEKGLAAVKAYFNESRYKSTSISKIMATNYPKIKWAVKDIIPEGLTILAGRPKFGKSWLMLGLSYAIATGTKAWMFGETTKGSVYYLALEDSERRLQDRVLSMEGYFDDFPENLHIYTDFPRIGEGFIEEVELLIAGDDNIGVIIVDTLQKIRPKSNGGKRNLYQAEYEDYEKVQKLAITSGVPIITVHHTRKGSNSKAKPGNPIDEMSGSTGIQGVADTLIVCVRDGSEGVMHVTGREVNEEDYPMVFNKRNMTWELFKPESAQVDVGNMMLADWFKNNTTITAQEAAGVFDMNERTARRKLKKLAEEGKLQAHDRLNRNEPIVYSVKEIFT